MVSRLQQIKNGKRELAALNKVDIGLSRCQTKCPANFTYRYPAHIAHKSFDIALWITSLVQVICEPATISGVVSGDPNQVSQLVPSRLVPACSSSSMIRAIAYR